MPSEILYRAATVRAEDLADSGEINLIASTDAPVDMGGYREVLEHTPGSIDRTAAQSLLLNHDRNQIIGGIRSIDVVNGQMRAKVFILESAKTAAGTSVRELVKSGALQGVSIGYSYSRDTADYDEATNTVRASKWSLREITLTPTAADTKAHVVRSLPEGFKSSPINNPGAELAPDKKGSPSMADEIKAGQGEPAATVKNDEAARAAEIKSLREERDALHLRGQIALIAESHGLRGSDFLAHKSIEDATRAMIEAKAKVEASDVKVGGVRVEVGVSEREKIDAAVADGVLGAHGLVGKDDKDLGLRGRGILDLAAVHASRSGVRNAAEWNKADKAAYILGKPVPGMSQRAAPNVTSSNFNTVVLANIMDKAVFHGFGVAQTTYQMWCGRRVVSDFKTFGSGALDTGNLVSTAEAQDFPELNKAEGSYTGALGLWGATISLSFQALVNDDLGEFMRMLNRAGQIAARTIDKNVYSILEGLTWTGNTTTGAAPISTAGNLDKVRYAFDTKTGPAGETLGNIPKFLIAPSCLRKAVLQETTQIQAYPQATLPNTDLIPIITPYLTQNGTPANSTYYLTADPALVDTVTVAFLQGAETPMVMEYDAGAMAARKWKIMQAFVPVGGSTTVASTTYNPGMQQGTT